MGMPLTFLRSARALYADSPRSIRFGGGLTLLLAIPWSLWFFEATVPVYTASERARIETIAARSVEAPVAGQVKIVRAALGQSVRAGDVLIELDTAAAALTQQGHELEHQSASSEAERTARDITAESASLSQWRIMAVASHEEAMARFREADELARLAEQEATRDEQLFRTGLVSATERSRTAAEALRRRAAATTLAAAAKRTFAEQQIGYSTKLAAIEKLRSDYDAVLARGSTAAVGARLAEKEIEERIIRAPITGRVAAEIPIRPGSVVRQGDRLTSIIPAGGVHVVADFRVATSLGRVRPGQPARLRLDAYSPIEYGWIQARVTRVASEPTDGYVRVELDITSHHLPFRIEHGLTGTAEVETERLAPADLVLRAVGRRTNDGN